ncbi:MAG: hypothetical protein LKH33_10300 [Acetobacter sp.]|jgi:hypothetical protein|nr:hypothetical protein [Acetobacter sp.]MCH4060530.1 hypothetical protein [Acetobacter sp.]MCH4087470.1 hypothetical protein [Acetobacter sp.]MCI1294671.1 hypothetical protein [Acetobacter sp.]MCI1321180.1 hypothetical protein [Acetobacter sp.]
MDYTNAPGHVTDSKGRRQFIDRDDANGVEGTEITAADLNGLVNEICNVILNSGLSLSGSDQTLLWQAIEKVVAEETVRAENSESSLLTRITNEISRAQLAEGDLQASLNSEVTRAKGAESGLQNNINTEVSNRISAVSAALAAAQAFALSSLKAGTGLNISGLAPGYWELPGGLILQWGSTGSGNNGLTTVYFPIAFPKACFFGFGNEGHAGDQWDQGNVSVTGSLALGTTAMTLKTLIFNNTEHTFSLTSGISTLWFAIGI